MMSDTRHAPASDKHAPDRETLSALFDGELHGDGARFAMRRLGHDAHWRDACGRWQLLGDVLRGQASAQAPADFAARVEAALAAERVGQAALATREDRQAAPAPRRWGRIGGAALAASVAVVAVLSLRPGLDGSASAPPQEAVATAPAPDPDVARPPEARVASVPQVNAPAPVETPAQPASELGLAAAAVAVAELPRRARGQSTRSQAQRAGTRAARGARAPLQVASAAPAGSTAVATLTAPMESDELHPFLPDLDEVPSRPWPRAAMPPGGAFTASYRTAGYPETGDEIRSFYPFEPRLPQQPQPRSELSSPLREGPRP